MRNSSDRACRHVALVDETDFFLEGLAAALSRVEDAPEVDGIDSHGVRHIELDSGTVILLELPEPGIASLAVLEEIVGVAKVPVAVFSDGMTAEVVLECVRRGARGFVSKSADPTTMVSQLHDLASGVFSVDSRVGGQLARFAAEAPLAAWPGRQLGLSQRESEVLVLLAGGLTNREISERLIVGVETVKSHARAIYRKLGVRNRVEVSTAYIQ